MNPTGQVDPCPLTCYNTINRNGLMTSYDLTPEEQRILAEATPQEVADALSEIATDRQFWQDLGAEMLQSFTEGFLRGLNR